MNVQSCRMLKPFPHVSLRLISKDAVTFISSQQNTGHCLWMEKLQSTENLLNDKWTNSFYDWNMIVCMWISLHIIPSQSTLMTWYDNSCIYFSIINLFCSFLRHEIMMENIQNIHINKVTQKSWSTHFHIKS